MRAVRGVPVDRLAAAALAALVALGLAVAAVANLPYPGMWWDEAASFWGSQGLSRYAPPFAAPGSLRDVVRMNRSENLDPGGFHLLLHLWTRLGRGLAWLRALPFAFFLLCAACLGTVGWRLTRSGVFAAASSASLLLIPGTTYFAFEIRAFSMESAGAAAGALALVFALERPSSTRFLLLGATCAAFLSSRYSYAFTAAGIVSAALVVSLRRGASRHELVRWSAAAIGPLLVAAAAIVRVTTAQQLWPEMRAGRLGVAAPAYVWGSILRGNPRASEVVLRNAFAPAWLPITCAVAFCLFVRPRVSRALAPARGDDTTHSHDRVGALYAFVLAVEGLSIAASLLGVYPWDVGHRWSAYLSTVSALAAVALAADGVALTRLALRPRPALGDAVRTAGVVLASAAVVVAFVRTAGYRQLVAAPHRADVTPQLDRLPASGLRDGCVFVTYYEVPMVRYLYEYGPYSYRAEYPRVFRFETADQWASAAPVDAARDGIEYVVTALPLTEARARFPDASLAPVAGGDRSLLRVTPAAPGWRPE
ncbi:MAG TPA: hypothetical protein VMT19_08250 [Thermoanaerobaculaceae bacterium]|nr:hypothetical protein [Thermoanaerobaculaceae bacterium]